VISLQPTFTQIYYLQLRGESEKILPQLEIYERADVDILNHAFAFRIIGASHFIYSLELNYTELFSCTPLSLENLEVLDVRQQGFERLIQFENHRLKAETRISVEAYPNSQVREDKPLLAHHFEPEGMTLIDIEPRGWYTLHTYPEHQSCVHTQTTLHLVETKG
tara:strand:+ start:719 stop:1210 length:492 start_codon:yes stop_codon:yes gene_type:complete